MLDPVVTNFVDAAILQLRRLDLMRTCGELPPQMRDESRQPRADWISWKPILSQISNSDLDELEAELGLAYPPLYRDLLRYQHFVDLTERFVRFESHLPDRWRLSLRNFYHHAWLPERIIDIGLIPFGAEARMDAGPVCFDTRRRMSDGDCTVVFWDHEWVGTEKEIQPLFSSSRKMFECLLFGATAEIDFTYHGEWNDPSQLPEKPKLMAEFLAIDPSGAGGPARNYWTAWGVAPLE